MLFIYGFLTCWFIFSLIIYFVSFHTSQTTNWDDWFYFIICFPFLVIAIPATKISVEIVRFWNEIRYRYANEWKWKIENFFHKPY